MKLKKLISAVISAAMLTATAVMPIRAEASTWWELDNTAVTNSTTIAATANVGGGKAANDDVLKYTGETFIRLNTTYNMSEDKMLRAPLSDMTQYKGYMIVSMNVMSSTEKQNIAITTNSGNIIMANNAGGNISVNSNNGFTVNRWNNVVCLIRLDKGSTTSLQTTYVNGKQVSERAHNLFSSGKTDVRLNAGGTGDVYFDDVKVQFTTEVPDMTSITAMPVLTGIDGKAVVNGSALDVTGDIKVSELAAVNSNITVFESASFKNVLSSDASLETGNVAVVTGDNGKMSYYTVNSTDVWTLNNESVLADETQDNVIKAVTNAPGGKNAQESVLYFNNTAEKIGQRFLDYDGHILNGNHLVPLQSDMSSYKGYMVVSMNVLSPVETQYIALCTNSNIPVANHLSVSSEKGFVKNEWNNVVMVVQLDSDSANRVSETFVNGIYQQKWTHNLYNTQTAVRLIVGGNNDAFKGVGEVYVDDVKIQFTTEKPNMPTTWILDNNAVTNSTTIAADTNAGGGKAASDDVLKYSGTTWMPLNTTNNMSEDKMLKAPLADMTQYTGYMIVSMNVMSAVNTQKIRITTNGGNTIMGDRDKGGYLNVNADNGFVQNRWNSVVCVIALNNGSTESTQTTYINGKAFGPFKHNLFSSEKTDVRLNADGTGDVYFDDVKVQFTTEEPDIAAITAMPEKPAVGYDITLAQAKEQGAIRVYSENTLAVTDELSDEDIVKHGYAVAKEVVDENGYTKYVYSYAGRKDGVLFVLNDSDYSNNKTVAFNARTENGTFDWSSTGLGGKAADDMSAKMTFVPTGTNPANGEATYLYFDYVREEDGTYDYMVFDYNVFIPEETADKFYNVGMASNGGAALGGWFSKNELKVGAWNNIVSVLKFNGEEAPTYTSYVNGKLTDEGTANSRFVTEAVPQIRLVFNAYNLETDANLEREEQKYLYEGFSAYADDIKIYGSSTPYVPQESLVDEVMNESYAIADNADGLYTKTMTVDEAKALVTAKYSMADVKVLRGGAEVTEGNIAIGDVIWYKPYADKEIYGRLVVKSGPAIINNDGTINAAYYEQDAKVIIAEYESGTELDTVVFGDGFVSYEVKDTSNAVAVMVWDDFDTCKPLCSKINISFE